MKKFVAALGALLVLAANVSLCEAQTEKSYFKAGGELRLSPVPVSEQITSIVWKYDKNLLAEWVKGLIDLTYYSKFNGRSELNTTTGVLVIQKMTAADTGLYSVEINNKVQSQVYQTVEIQEVPQPTVELQPLACNRPQKCGLKCYGDFANAEPVRYFWRNDDGEWEESGDRKELSSKEMDDVITFYCRVKNPVSQKDSKPYKNPYYQENKPAETSSPGPIVGGVVGGLLVLGVLIGLGIWKRDLVRQKIPFLSSGATSESTPKNDNMMVENKGLLNHDVESGKPPSPNGGDSGAMSEVTPPPPAEMPSTNDDKGEGDDES